ncbi:hypothetical protein C7S18_23150 [Ahniella affigens]|uniref:DUF268 domain-containing protein n=2 Tax=Ahniella affigens TaxID=2021234 RepID=A0A2P1PZH2_9GAMM|nr:hypothetical protein C7S18_23150 [Ahniella affigens]
MDPFKFVAALRTLPRFHREWRQFRRALRADPTAPPISIAAHLHDRQLPGGDASGHYFHQDLYVAKRVFQSAPIEHIDVGSRIDGFVAHVAVFRRITVIDLRPNRQRVGNIEFRQADMSAPLNPDLVACCDSLSCLHALEHFGLGRYGDPVDPDAHRRGLRNLHAMLKPGGTLYLSVPIGPSRIEFNAQRVFALPALLRWVGEHFTVQSLAVVDDAGELHEQVALEPSAVDRNLGCRYGCAILELRKA